MSFFLAIVRRGYSEFEQRAGQVKAPRGAKTALVEDAINSFPAQVRPAWAQLVVAKDLGLELRNITETA